MDRQFTKTFLCPNNIIGGRRRHRLALLNELVDRGLIENNFVSFPLDFATIGAGGMLVVISTGALTTSGYLI
jgi:hypothetical protein